ncbi:MAG TPA: hypothetical protein PKG95_06365 [Anaerolineaceae bacterium]|jgi:Flp pilus assembly pilin Flp|nr:hypothetical protein [Anaerolineaceae bacterium]
MEFLRDRTAIESTEVALIIAAVVLVAYGAYVLLGNKISLAVTDVADKV